MKLDPTVFRYITKDEFRVLTAVEMGMKNHELVPAPLIESLARGSRGGTYKILQSLLRNKLLAHDGKKYDGYRLTYHGYDFLALRALVLRGTITSVGRRLGVGKESDVHYCKGPEGEVLALKLHRLGRISFRAIKEKRDYLRHREHASWMYMARLAALKEFAYMKALRDEGFPVPTAIDQNRHAVVMSFVDAVPLYRIRQLEHPEVVLERLMRLIVRLAHAGIVHGDFNEFNLMIGPDRRVTVIDFPQIIGIGHENAREHFERDVTSTCDFFRRRLAYDVEKWPTFDEVLAEIAARGGSAALASVAVDGLGLEDDAMLVAAHEEDRHLADVEGLDEDANDDGGASADEAVPEGAGDGAGPLAEAEAEEPEETSAAVEFHSLLPDRAADGQEAGEEEAEDLDEGAVEAEVAKAAAGVPQAGDQEAEEVAQVEAAKQPSETDGQDEGGESEGNGDDSGSEASDRPGQVTVNTGGRRPRRRQVTAKEARKNLQKQQRQKPARPNNSKAKEFRRAKSEIKEFL